MPERSYEIDDQGNLVESGAAAPVGSGEPSVDAGGSVRVVTREGIRGVTRAIVLSEVLGVLLLIGSAFDHSDLRTLLLCVAAGYAVVSVFVTVIVRRSLLKRLGQPIQPD